VAFNTMMAPFARSPTEALRVAGLVWYQGEDNAMAGQETYYRCALPALVASWRALLDSPAAWAGVVQLAPWTAPAANAAALNAAVTGVREAQLAARDAVKGLSVVTAIDVGDPHAPNPIHSPHKTPIGVRMARAAAAALYGLGSGSQGPAYAGATSVTAGSRVTVTVSFDAAGVGAGLQLAPAQAGNWSTYCPVEAAVDPSNCAWFGVQTSEGTWRNATPAVVGATLTLTVDTAPATGLTAVATSNGAGLWPVVTLRNAAGLPAFVWLRNLTSAAAA
jgi:hypothetical protein